MRPKYDGQYNRTILKNGIRIVSEKIPWVSSVCLGVWVDIGSRNETPKESGVSHLIEHMLFKGTKKRTAKQIAITLESIGGSLNAFTGRENTCYYAKVMDRDLGVAVDLLSDIIKNPLFAPIDFKKEKRVIMEEINELEDSPSELIFDLFMESLYKKQALGKPILGTTDNIKRIKREEVLSYYRKNYISPKIVVSASGNVSHKSLVRRVKEKFNFNQDIFDSYPKGKEKPVSFSQMTLTRRDIAQTHICIGFPALDFNHSRKYPALVLSNILGGGMSSRLFQTVRENLGLVYNIQTFFDFYLDTGILGVYLATNSDDVHRAVEAVLGELFKVKKSRLPKTELENAKYNLKGNLILGAENVSYRMNRIARHELYSRTYRSLRKSISAVEKVEATEVKEVAKNILNPKKICVNILGPVKTNKIKNIDWKHF
ncbi:MAG: hypothetical protein AMJ90_07965 [candidate division Zixibacteria bacterium SM23_73_2]|nr:MAG: hypothetical protein AMJ90_07965 [candidate division Zixibacteria bacterium SM23_73_2]